VSRPLSITVAEKFPALLDVEAFHHSGFHSELAGHFPKMIVFQLAGQT
jgi:hypothetical protein